MNNGIIKKGKINSLQAIRALAFIEILIAHCEGPASGACGVSIFLILSGFLMIYSYLDRELECSLKNCVIFSVKKIKKLYPLHIITMLLPMLLVLRGIILDFSGKAVFNFIAQIFLNITLLQSWVPVTDFYFSFNGVAWYLSTCLFIYAVFPFILRKFKKTKMKNVAFIGVVTFACQIIVGIILKLLNLYSTSHFITYIFPIFRLGDFLIGCCLGYIFLNVNFKLNKIQATVIEIISLVLIVFSDIIYLKNKGVLGSYYFKFTVLFIPVSVLLVWIFAINKGVISKLLTCKPIVYIGNISPYAFLIHNIIISIVRVGMYKFILSESNVWFKPVLIVVSFVLTVLSSAAYMAIEKKLRPVLTKKFN